MGQSLSIKDNRTGRDYELPIEKDTIRAMDLRKIRVEPDDFGLMAYDPGFMNTACCRSSITFIDGDKGILLHRGYPIEQLAEHNSFLEVAYLLLFGELPQEDQYREWREQIADEASIPEPIVRLIQSFPKTDQSMGMLVSAIAALSACYPEAGKVEDPANRRRQIVRLIGEIPTLAAFIYRHQSDLPFVFPSDRDYAGNFLHMMFSGTKPNYEVHPDLEKALDVLFVLHADHEQNCSTSAMRCIGSSRSDPYLAAAGAVGALAGPLHGGANEAVLKMLRTIETKERIPEYIERVKKGEFRLMGFGHRVYKNYDPRARIIKRMADQVFKVTGTNPLLDIALELEQIALQDDYFKSRKLYPNVDFYSGLIYQAMGFPPGMFPVLFAIGRTVGWLSQWEELINDPEQKIVRPRQIYEGPARRDVPALAKAKASEKV
ncbi:MAG TPA: citrate synthase [Acidobacteriota bacterium]|nr:citrate synthase [Acidobacteriota bacterium]